MGCIIGDQIYERALPLTKRLSVLNLFTVYWQELIKGQQFTYNDDFKILKSEREGQSE